MELLKILRGRGLLERGDSTINVRYEFAAYRSKNSIVCDGFLVDGHPIPATFHGEVCRLTLESGHTFTVLSNPEGQGLLFKALGRVSEDEINGLIDSPK